MKTSFRDGQRRQWWLCITDEHAEALDNTFGLELQRLRTAPRMTKADHDKPQTFSLADVQRANMTAKSEGNHGEEDFFLVNTGLFVARLTEPWVDFFPGFRMEDAIHTNPNGEAVALTLPEDWSWSLWMHVVGLKVFATRKATLGHWEPAKPGEKPKEYRNDHVWGDWQTDHGDTPQTQPYKVSPA